MSVTVRDISLDADLFRRAYPHWPHPEPEPSGEFTIAWGEDTNCTDCGYFLPAGAPAWLDDEGRPLCCDCAAKEN